MLGAENAFLEATIRLKTDHFAKTGSGQTQATLKKRRFSQGVEQQHKQQAVVDKYLKLASSADKRLKPWGEWVEHMVIATLHRASSYSWSMRKLGPAIDAQRRLVAILQGTKTGFRPTFNVGFGPTCKQNHVTKTGSGQTQGKLKKRSPFAQGAATLTRCFPLPSSPRPTLSLESCSQRSGR
jgi:hypothetical protein